MTRGAKSTSGIHADCMCFRPNRIFVGLAEKISNEKREPQRHQACRFDSRCTEFPLHDLMKHNIRMLPEELRQGTAPHGGMNFLQRNAGVLFHKQSAKRDMASQCPQCLEEEGSSSSRLSELLQRSVVDAKELQHRPQWSRPLALTSSFRGWMPTRRGIRLAWMP